MKHSNIVITVTDFLKPVLMKIFPKELLSSAKKRYMQKNTSKLVKVMIEPMDKEAFPVGINLIGNIKADTGLGQSNRLLANELENSKYALNLIQHSISDKISMHDTTYDAKLVKDNDYLVNIFHINAHEFTLAYMQFGKKKLDKHYNIAYWLWEIEDFPDEWVDCISLLDEIWTPAEFVSESIRKKTNKPVVTVPYAIEAPVDEKYDRKYFGLPEDRFLFLMMFDSGSMIERKNPTAVFEAFKKAFEKDDKHVGLVIKINGAKEDDVKYITGIMEGYSNIYIINKTYSKVAVNSLIKSVDVVVSLHRAEGFGLVMAEAMVNGTPCIATNWSANTEFMNDKVACMVDYQLVELKQNIGPYKKGIRWADPDVEQAAEYMKKLYMDPEYYHMLCENAREFVQNKLSMENVKKIIEKRMEEIIG